MVDLAGGVIIGAAFGKIVDSLVKHLIRPLIGVIMPGEQGYLAWEFIINGKAVPYELFLGEAEMRHFVQEEFPTGSAHNAIIGAVCPVGERVCGERQFLAVAELVFKVGPEHGFRDINESDVAGCNHLSTGSVEAGGGGTACWAGTAAGVW